MHGGTDIPGPHEQVDDIDPNEVADGDADNADGDADNADGDADNADGDADNAAGGDGD